jgi:hypothetical protein
MATIIGVHGIGHQFGGENALSAQWLPALKDGLARAGREWPEEVSFKCAFYGDLFRPQGKGAMPPYDAQDVDAWESQMLELWWAEAARTDPGVRAPDELTKAGAMSVVQKALDALTRSRFFAGVLEKIMISDLKQVHQYFHDPVTRLAARARIEERVTGDTRVIVAHSLGSVVAYEALCANPQWSVQHLITLGSPLGIRHLIFDALDPAPRRELGLWPGSVEHWTNVSDSSDVVALTKRLEPLFMPRIVDVSVGNGMKVHDAGRYLNTREVGDAIAAAL